MEPSMPNTDRVARPSKLSPEDIARQAAAVARYDSMRRMRRIKYRVARLTYVSIWVFLIVWLFYSATN